MPYFVRIGAIPANVYGVGSRGYHVFRRAKKVMVRWGAVEVRPGRRFYWLGTQEKEYPHRSLHAARERLRSEIERRVTREKYSRLPKGQKIHYASSYA
jgi:hypothetical protein